MKIFQGFLGIIFITGICIFFKAQYYYDELAKFEEIIPKKLEINTQSNLFINENYKIEISQNAFIVYAKDYKDKWIEMVSNFDEHSFVGCAVVQTDYDQKSGFWIIKNKVQKHCVEQTIDYVQQINNTHCVIKGNFNDCDNESYEIVFKLDDIGLQLSLSCKGSFNHSMLFLKSSQDELFYGGGIQSSKLNMKGEIFSIFSREHGLLRLSHQPYSFLEDVYGWNGGNWYYTYYYLPLLIQSNFQKAFYLKNSQYAVFDLKQQDLVKIHLKDANLNFLLIDNYQSKVDKRGLQMIQKITSFTGRMKKLPKWITRGAVLGLQGGTDIVKQKYRLFEKFQTPISGLWLQDWSGSRMSKGLKRLWWNWELNLYFQGTKNFLIKQKSHLYLTYNYFINKDENLYHNWNEFIQELDQKNIKMLTYVNSMVHNITGRKANYTQNQFEEGVSKNYFISDDQKNPLMYGNNDGFLAGILDLTNQDAVTWFKNIIKQNMLNFTKTMGFMADFGEDSPIQKAQLNSSNISPEEFHNLYPQKWHQLVREACDEYFQNNSEIVFFTRSGSPQTPKYTTLSWVGDQIMDFSIENGLKSALISMLTAGISGVSLTHSDIGGYFVINEGNLKVYRTEELFIRWMELAAFSAVFRTHEGNIPDLVLQVYSNDNLLQAFARNSKIYAALQDYRDILMEQAENSGMPLMRLMSISYPDDDQFQNCFEQFMYGDDFIVAPVLDSGIKSIRVLLPNDDQIWINIWNNNEYQFIKDPSPTIQSEIGKIVILFKKQSIYAQSIQKSLQNI